MMRFWSVLFFSFLSASFAWSQEPQSQPTNLSFSNVKPFGFNLSFTPSTADGFLVLRSSAGPVTFVPQDGVEYQKGQGLTQGVKVFAADNLPSLSVREVLAGRTYHFAVFAYNGTGSGINYRQSGPLTGSISVPGGNYGSYYSTLGGGSPTFLADLKNRLNLGRVFQTYTPGFLNYVMRNVYIRDTVGGMEVINCQYTGEAKVYNPPLYWGSSVGEYSREHMLPQSWMLTVGGTTSDQDRADYHNLLPVNHANANSKRSNYPYGIVQNASYQYLQGKLGTNSQGNTVYEPRDDIKGDVARAQFYMMVCYNGNGGTWAYPSMPTLGPQQNQDLLKTWHIQDPPDAFEITRHEYIYSLQNNRNPFIDFPEWVDCINFNTLTVYSNCAITLDADEVNFAEPSFSVFPNPASDQLTISGLTDEAAIFSMYDMNGRMVYSANSYAGQPIDISMIPTGIYTLQVRGNEFLKTQKVVITK
jgi:endonuclease I